MNNLHTFFTFTHAFPRVSNRIMFTLFSPDASASIRLEQPLRPFSLAGMGGIDKPRQKR